MPTCILKYANQVDSSAHGMYFPDMVEGDLTQEKLEASLSDLHLGGIKFFASIDSTNTQAIKWAAEGAKDLSLVLADEQLQGRGRNNRQWFSPMGTNLAISLILRLSPLENQVHGLFSCLGALATVQAIENNQISNTVQIKWPNDVLIDGKKVCGILVEASWLGSKVESMVIGIGVNLRAGAFPETVILNYPATSLETATGQKINRLKLLHDILEEMISLRTMINEKQFVNRCEKKLAFLDQPVKIIADKGPAQEGILRGMTGDGGLRLEIGTGEEIIIRSGDVHLRLKGE